MRNFKNKFTKALCLAICAMLGVVSAYAQNVTVRGSVVDENGEVIVGATVVVKGTTNATMSDFDGNFSLSVPAGSTLQVTYIGYSTAEIASFSPNTPIKVTLVDEMKELNEVVVVGYGQQKKASIVGAITQTTGEVLERAGGVSSVGAALTGNLPGVVTSSSTGMPGDEDPKIVIRGVSSWNNSDPLILVDGIERPMGSVDIASIQSISVLKDASATAVYGVKGANGVILITTKRGNEGNAHIEVNLNATAKVVSKLPGTLQSADALYVRNQAIENELALNPGSWDDILPMATIDKYRNPANLEESERYPNVDWQKALFKDYAMAYNASVSMAGGTDFVRYFAALDYLHEGDLFREYDNGRGYDYGYGFDRINVRSNLDFNITKTTLLKANISGSTGFKRSPWAVADDSFGASQLWQAAYSAPADAFLPVYSDGTWGYFPVDSQSAPNSMLNLAIAGQETITTTRINTDFTIEQDLGFLLEGLKVSGVISWDNVFRESGRGINDLYDSGTPQQKWINPETGEVVYREPNDAKQRFDFLTSKRWKTQGGNVDNWATQRNLFYQGQIYWGNQFGMHNVTAMGVVNRTERAQGDNFPSYREDWAFRTTYSLADKYFLEYNGAYNGSEKFSEDNRFAFFNSGAIGWMMSEENFFAPLKQWVDLLKVRYSYGEIGDDNINARFLYNTQWEYGGNAFQGIKNENNSPYTFYKEKQIGNPDVHWEKAIKQNLGIDYSFLGGLVAGSVEIFHENRSDILIGSGNRAVLSMYGASPVTANLGKTRTNGYEVEIRLNKSFSNGIRAWGNFNMTHAETEVLKYDDAQGAPDYQKVAGYTINQQHSHVSAGYAQTWDDVIAMTQHDTNDQMKLPGQLVAVDFNADGVIDSDDSVPYAFSGTPQNTYNATIGIDYKGWSAFVQFYGVNNVTRQVGFNSLPRKGINTVFDEGSYWSKDNLNPDVPMPRYISTPSYYDNERFMYDGSFIRLKNAEVSYTFRDGWVKTIGMNEFKIYLNGNNIWVKTKMPDDRESNFAGTGLASQGAYPTVKRFNFGVKFNL